MVKVWGETQVVVAVVVEVVSNVFTFLQPSLGGNWQELSFIIQPHSLGSKFPRKHLGC